MLLGFVELVTVGGMVQEHAMPPFHEMMESFWSALRGGFVTDHVTVTLRRVVMAFGIGVGLAFFSAILFWKLPLLGKSLEPVIAASSAIPFFFVYPILLLTLGINDRPMIVLAAHTAFVPMLLNTFTGLTEIRRIVIKVGKTFGCSTLRMYRQIIFPAAAPYIMTGLKLSFMYTFIAIVALEFLLGASKGLGFSIKYSYETFRIRQMYGYLVFLVIISATMTITLNWIESRLRGRYQ
ncbi:MAG TPA: ABC transporter permease subunit, partial [Dehalococcoidia bacterium]|nr:ABC transporter permease subunit [Dehalococcoidia bacterium]